MERFADGRLQTQVEVVRFLEQHPNFPLTHKGKVHLQRIREIFTKPVYAGFIDIPDWGLSLVKGHHEPLISFEAYQRIQERLNGKAHAPTRKADHEEFTLRGSVACGSCGHAMTGAFSKGRHRYYGYYFCQNKSCSEHRKNIRKEDIEEQFRHLLARMAPTARTLSLFKDLMQEAWDQRTEIAKSEHGDLKTTLGTLERKTEKMMERLVATDDPTLITAYENQIRKLQEDKLVIEEKLQKQPPIQGSFEDTYRTAMEFLASPCNLWDNGDQDSRKLVLKLAFTDLIPFSRNGGYRTAPTSCIFSLLQGSNDNLLGMVRSRGLEPPRVAPLTPQASASTYSATTAQT